MSDLVAAVNAALATVIDPEIHRPITELDMVESVAIDDAGRAAVTVLLTITGCPMADTIESSVRQAVTSVPGVTDLDLTMSAMTDEQRSALKRKLRGGRDEREIPFAQADSRTQVLLVASGKGGVGKSSVTANLAMALAALGRTVGVLDADIYGHSIPQMLGLMDAFPTSVDGMIMPVPSMGMKVISIGMMKESREQVIAWRGPILDRALQQFLADVYWGDLDFLVVDLPPGTGDVALSLGHKLPNAEVLVVTTPQQAAAEVAERAGTMASMLEQKVIGVVENMAYLEAECPHCGETHRVDVFGAGGGAEVARTLTNRLGYEVPLLAEVPIDPELAAGGDQGVPLVATAPERPAAAAITELARLLSARKPSLAGRKLGVIPV
ncbi:MAG: Mrp/NBP35 family ATP-binding protein [Propionibacteriaceae bacterium]|jgi:ATP-binding protein involved in chromosome partitioning|nr:Mrp/NBP35 family ATP-binding protein [Propionibacteriaceae bacterium]